MSSGDCTVVAKRSAPFFNDSMEEKKRREPIFSRAFFLRTVLLPLIGSLHRMHFLTACVDTLDLVSKASVQSYSVAGVIRLENR